MPLLIITVSVEQPQVLPGCANNDIYWRTCLDGYLIKKLGILALLYVHIGDYLTTFEVF